LLVCPIFAALPPTQQLKVFEPAPPNARKVILATNIAETSITINGIKYVIDTGVVKSREYNAKIGLDTLRVQTISKAAAMQRAGRAGRESSGKCFRLYTEETFASLPDSTVPEIQRSNLANVVLQLKAIGIDDILSFDFMDKPPLTSLKKALEVLIILGALDTKLAITTLGRKIAQLPLEPTYSKVVLLSLEMGCLRDVLSIVSMLSVESVFYSPRDKRAEADKARLRFFHDDGDHLALLGVYKEYSRNEKNAVQWCWDNFINQKAFKKVIDVRTQLVEYMQNMGTPQEAFSQGGPTPDSEKIRKCFVSGFSMNAAQLMPDKKTYTTIIDHKEVYVHPNSVLINKKPPCVLFNELVFTTKEYMRGVMKIEQNWLTELAPAQYQKVKLTSMNKTTNIPSSTKPGNGPKQENGQALRKAKFSHFSSMVDNRMT